MKSLAPLSSAFRFVSTLSLLDTILVVGLVDNIVKPMVIKGGIEMHGAVVFFALIGGFAVFGPIGLVLGPLSVTFLLSILRIYQRDFGTGESPA